MRKRILIYFNVSKHFDSSELGIPLEVFRKKRALGHKEENLHFNEFTLKILKSSNAHRLVEPLLDTK